MGLFSSILSGLGGAVGSILGAKSNAKAVKNATAAQVQAAQLGIDEERRQFDLTRSDNLPFLQAGQQALGQQGNLLGLNGGDVQQGSIDALQNSPLFQSLFRSGQDTILNNASATGGLRGGNTQGSLANFGRDTLAQVIQQQLANLGGLSGQGASTGISLGGLGADSANQIANLFGQQGQAKAGGILGKQGVYNNLSSQISSLLSTVAGGMGGGFGGGAAF